MSSDSQVVELIGRNWLAAQLFAAGVEVARPERDRGVDLIAYVERGAEGFHAVPIQPKAASASGFSIFRKYARAADLLLASVWWLAEPAQTVCYAMTHAEAVAIAERLGWTRNASWTERGLWTVPRPGRALVAELEPYRMDATAWRDRVTGTWRRAEVELA